MKMILLSQHHNDKSYTQVIENMNFIGICMPMVIKLLFIITINEKQQNVHPY